MPLGVTFYKFNEWKFNEFYKNPQGHEQQNEIASAQECYRLVQVWFEQKTLQLAGFTTRQSKITKKDGRVYYVASPSGI